MGGGGGEARGGCASRVLSSVVWKRQLVSVFATVRAVACAKEMPKRTTAKRQVRRWAPKASSNALRQGTSTASEAWCEWDGRIVEP
jgi:hypothetical protein